MYTFDDKSGNSISLRPENTAGVVRAFLNQPRGQMILPQKYFYHGPMFRYERPQKGRVRQFHQIGIENIGDASVYNDVEVISSAFSFLKKIGLDTTTKLLINTLGDEESRASYRTQLKEYFTKYEGFLSNLSKERLKRGSVLRILDSKNPQDISLIEDAPSILDCLTRESQQRFDNLCKILVELGVPIHVQSKLVRGLDYYRHTVFEFVEKGTSSAILAGGRYDNLLSDLGGPSGKGLGAIGWAAGIERIENMIKDDVLPPPIPLISVIVIRQTGESDSETFGLSVSEIEIHGLKIAERLRHSGFQVELIYERNATKQLTKALKRGSSAAVILGEEEIRQNRVQIKIFSAHKQESYGLDEMEMMLKRELKI